MAYLTGPGHESRPAIEGAIIQGPVSDREALVMLMEPDLYRSSCIAAQKMVDEGNGEEILPTRETKNAFPAPCTARRWLSLASPDHDGDDDYFSSDLSDEQLMKTFGALPARTLLCILISGSDEYVPKSVDKVGLFERWMGIVKRGQGEVDKLHSGIIDGASHNLAKDGEEVVRVLVQRVLGFLETVEKTNLLQQRNIPKEGSEKL